MRIQWHGQSAFDLAGRVFIDPFGDVSSLAARGMQFDYPAIEGMEPELLLVTHEHLDHNGVEAIGGSPAVIRSTAGTLESPVGEVVAVASEHDEVAGTHAGRTRSTSSRSTACGSRTSATSARPRCATSRPTRSVRSTSRSCRSADGPTIGAAQARELADRIGARWVVPMHYRTPRIGFLETADAFLELFGDDVVRLDTPAFDTADLPDSGPTAVVPAAP